jgi:hypothetical protein
LGAVSVIINAIESDNEEHMQVAKNDEGFSVEKRIRNV